MKKNIWCFSIKKGDWHLATTFASRLYQTKHKGAALGVWWSLLQPLIMLSIYTFVFTTVFKSRWSGMEDVGSLGYAANLFVGLTVFNIFAESVGAAPGIISGNANLVKKVLFPVEILCISQVLCAMAQGIVSGAVMLCFAIVTTGHISPWIVTTPLVWIPLGLWCLGICWAVSALSVYVKDIEQFVPLAVSMAMFLSAVFYPIDALPGSARILMSLNPIASAIEQTRGIVMIQEGPDLMRLSLEVLVGMIVCEIGFRTFKALRRGFADVL